MNYKIKEGSTMTFAGVASYEAINNAKNSNNDCGTNMKFDFDFCITDEEIKNIKEKAKEAKEKAKESAKKAFDNVNNSEFLKNFENKMEKFATNIGQWSENFGRNMGNTNDTTNKKNEASANTDDAKSTDENSNSWSLDFENRMENFGENIKSWGKGLEKDMEKLGENFKTWGKGFEKEMESLGINLKSWGKDFEKSMEKFTHSMKEHWNNDFSADDYSLWELNALFNELYLQYASIQTADIKPELVYEIQSYDLNTTMNEQMNFVGCQIDDCKDIPHAFVTHQIKAENWLVLKLSQEEYQKDWMKTIDKIEEMDNYDIESLFIVRHYKDKEVEETKKIKIFIPLKEPVYEV